ncbi:pyridoxamine 5'-phosphate oxidase family protein [Microbacterium sp. G2-8]|uniref:pyridoxamine 5'-phosphate oxidase family protein n=1 Tax=Microbacterium sp. G2-8 TaxID=2842454 RepID=UPI001C8A6259|nr:pyridoxamine 5'-phosphate oxidase family protein [Microbacterium sp. G2-8]
MTTLGAPGNIAPDGLDRPVQDGRVPADPFSLVRAWLPRNDDPDRPLCTLATVDAVGAPDARTVLLSAVQDDSVTIHTEGQTRKAQQLRERPPAAIVVRWPDLARQLVLRGDMRASTSSEARVAFARRSRYLQLLASVNTDELATRPRVEREAAYARFDQHTPDPPQPASWAGFALHPVEITFWEGSDRGPSRRARYTRRGASWDIAFLAG